MPKSLHRDTDPNVAEGLVTDTIPQSTVFANGLLVSVDGSCVTAHIPFEFPHAPTCAPKTANGAQTVRACGIPINRMDDLDTCDHPRAMGSPDVFIGDDA